MNFQQKSPKKGRRPSTKCFKDSKKTQVLNKNIVKQEFFIADLISHMTQLGGRKVNKTKYFHTFNTAKRPQMFFWFFVCNAINRNSPKETKEQI